MNWVKVNVSYTLNVHVLLLTDTRRSFEKGHRSQ